MTLSFSTNDWLIICNLIYKINTIQDETLMRKTFLEFVKILIPCNYLSFFLSNKDISDCLTSDPILIGFSDERGTMYPSKYEKFDYKRWIFASAKNDVFRLTDLFPPGKREATPFYKQVNTKDNIHYELILSLSYDNKFQGVVSLFRTREEGDFSDKDIQILSILKDHLAYRLYVNSQAISPNITNHSVTNSSRLTVDKIATYNFTHKETEILSLFKDGKQNCDICNKLFISNSTLKKHYSNIYKKLNIKSKIELLRLLE